MKRLESNFKNMVLSLTCITLVAAAALGGIYMLTEEPISQAKQAKQQAAIAAVLPAIDGLQVREAVEAQGLQVRKAFAGDQFVGAAVETEADGFGGKIRLMVGFDAEGNIVNYEVLEQQETPGLGTHIVEWFKTEKNRQCIIGINPEQVNFTVSKDGGDVDAITAATISSRAFLLAVHKAYHAYMDTESDAVSGATALVPDTLTTEIDTLQNVENYE